MALLLSLPTASHTHSVRASWAARYLLVAFALLTLVEPLRADLADDYLTGLRQRGWHDVALEYLEAADQDPLATPAFRKKLDFERATTQANLARQAAGEKQRQTLLAKATAGFEKFAQEQTDSPLQLQALANAGNLLTEQALYLTNKMDKLPAAARGQRKQLQDTARDLLSQAKQPLQKMLELCNSKLKSAPKAAAVQKNPRIQGSRQQLQAKQAEAKFLIAKLDFEKSRTYAADSKAQQQTLKAAAEAFAKLYEDYEEKLVGFYGRLYQGRSFQLAGDYEKALECYWDIVDQPPIANQDFRRLVARSFRYRAECHLAANDYEKVIKECSEWLDESRGPELSEPDWLAVSYRLASAYDIKANSAAGGDAQRLRTESRKLYREIAKNPGEFQRDARARLATSGSGNSKPVIAKTFDEAFEAGKDAFEQMNSAKLAARLAQENNPSSVESLNEQAVSHQAAALQLFQQATELADEETDVEQLFSARFYLCWLHWDEGRLEDAAVIGEFLARRYPENKNAPTAAKFALAAYERLYNDAKEANESTDFEAAQLSEIARLLVMRWPESPEAETALNLQINVALRDDRLADAEKLLEQLAPANRATAELRLGGAIWNRYLQAGDDPVAISLKQKAGELLSSGYRALKAAGQASAAEATGVLYFAQLLLASDQAGQAVEVLENPAVGPLSLVANKAPAAARPAFVQEAYKVALRAYVSVQPPQRDNAQKMMAALESAIGKKGSAQQKLISTYVSLGLQLQKQISSLTAAGKDEQATGVAAAFEDLLARVTERAGGANDWKIQNWIAQTNLQLGQGLQGKDADRYFQQAEQAYQTLLTKANEDPKFAPSPLSVLATRKRLADCLQAQQKYPQAYQHYTSILREKPNMLELQLAAATALQEWGVGQKDSGKLEESIRGAMPQANKKNLIWGWLRLAAIADQAKRKAQKKARSDPKQAKKVATYTNLFFEANYHVAQSRFSAAKLAQGAERQKQLRAARQILQSMKRLYPDLGGPKWQGLYLQLLKEMEQEK